MDEQRKEDPRLEVIDEETLAKYEADHGRVAVVKTALGVAVFRKPKPGEWDRFQDMALNDDKRKHAGKQLVLSCLLAPSVDEWRVWTTDYVALSSECFTSVKKLATGEVLELGKE